VDTKTRRMKRPYSEYQEGEWNEEPLSKRERRDNNKKNLPLDIWTVIVPFCDDDTWKRLSQGWREIRSLREAEHLMINRTLIVPGKIPKIRNLRQYLRAVYGALFNVKLGPLECLFKARIDEGLAQYLDKTRILEIFGCEGIDVEAFWNLRNVRELKLRHCGKLSPNSFAPLKNLKKLTLQQVDLRFTEKTFKDLEHLEVLHVLDDTIILNNMDGIEHMKNLRQLKLPYYDESTRDQISKRINKTIEILE
jgi:hypothetical protein